MLINLSRFKDVCDRVNFTFHGCNSPGTIELDSSVYSLKCRIDKFPDTLISLQMPRTDVSRLDMGGDGQRSKLPCLNPAEQDFNASQETLMGIGSAIGTGKRQSSETQTGSRKNQKSQDRIGETEPFSSSQYVSRGEATSSMLPGIQDAQLLDIALEEAYPGNSITVRNNTSDAPGWSYSDYLSGNSAFMNEDDLSDWPFIPPESEPQGPAQTPAGHP